MGVSPFKKLATMVLYLAVESTRLLSAKSPWYLRIERQILTILQLYLTKNLPSTYLAKMLKSLCVGSRWMSIEGRQELFCIPVYHGWFVIRRKQDLDKKVSVVKIFRGLVQRTSTLRGGGGFRGCGWKRTRGEGGFESNGCPLLNNYFHEGIQQNF